MEVVEEVVNHEQIIKCTKEDILDKHNACIEITNALKRTRDKIIEVLDIVKVTQLSVQISRYEGKASVYEELLNSKR